MIVNANRGHPNRRTNHRGRRARGDTLLNRKEGGVADIRPIRAPKAALRNPQRPLAPDLADARRDARHRITRHLCETCLACRASGVKLTDDLEQPLVPSVRATSRASTTTSHRSRANRRHKLTAHLNEVKDKENPIPDLLRTNRAAVLAEFNRALTNKGSEIDLVITIPAPSRHSRHGLAFRKGGTIIRRPIAHALKILIIARPPGNRHIAIDNRLERRITLDDHLDFIDGQIRRPDVNVNAARLISRRTGSVQCIGNRLKRRHARRSRKDRGNDLDAGISTVITHRAIGRNLPMRPSVMIITFDLAGQTRRTDRREGDLRRDPDAFNLHPKRPVRHHVYRIAGV